MPAPLDQRAPRRLAIVHYHLQPGGVTTVIENTVAALEAAADLRIVVISGAPYPGRRLKNVQVVPGLSYQASASQGGAEELKEALGKAAHAGLDGHSPDLWHCHNPSLGKHLHFPGALRAMLRSGHRLLLHIHDFAEDGRPANHALLKQGDDPYPLTPTAHYATINSRDRRLLVEACLPSSRVMELPNPVVSHGAKSADVRPGNPPILLYPTRGIRRKNLGEAVLLAALAKGKAFIATTRAPENPRWQPIHHRWASFARERRLPMAFAVVDQQSPADFVPGLAESTDASFGAWLRSARAVITTSVAEGFGMAYLESLLQGLPLMGRDLPDITADFKEQDLTFPGLYRALRVPLEWLGKDRLLETLSTGLQACYDAYQKPLPPDAAGRALASMTDLRGRIDFGRLSEPLQEEVIDRVINDDAIEEVIFETEAAFANADLWMESWLGGGLVIPRLDEQREFLGQHYSRTAYAKRLLACYQNLWNETESLDAPASARSNEPDVGERLLQFLLSPERFHFLKS